MHFSPPRTSTPAKCTLVFSASCLQDKESATIPELILLSAPDAHILLLAFTAGAAAALGQVREAAACRPTARREDGMPMHGWRASCSDAAVQ